MFHLWITTVKKKPTVTHCGLFWFVHWAILWVTITSEVVFSSGTIHLVLPLTSVYRPAVTMAVNWTLKCRCLGYKTPKLWKCRPVVSPRTDMSVRWLWTQEDEKFFAHHCFDHSFYYFSNHHKAPGQHRVRTQLTQHLAMPPSHNPPVWHIY